MIPATAKTPAISDSTAVVGPGSGSRISSATVTMIAAPSASTTIATPKTGARRPVQPPPKSPAPHATADARPKTTTPSPVADASTRSGSARRGSSTDRLRQRLVELGRTLEGDDGIRGLVV